MTKIWNWFLRGIALCVIWCLKNYCVLRGRVRIIKRPDQSEAYLIRYAIMGWLPGDKGRPAWLPNIYLHNIRLPDADPALHNHPWPWAVSLILRGGYCERRPIEKGANPFGKWITAGHFNVLKTPRDFHRISEVAEELSSLWVAGLGRIKWRGEGCWTLFVTSGKHSSWGFSVPGQGYVPHTVRAYTHFSDQQQGQISRVQKAMIDTLKELNDKETVEHGPAKGYTAKEKLEIIDVDFADLETRVAGRMKTEHYLAQERHAAPIERTDPDSFVVQDCSPEAVADLLGVK